MEDATLRSTRARARVARRVLACGDAALSAQLRPRVPVSHEALAMMLGGSRQTLSKQLRLLAANACIEFGCGYSEVLSTDAWRCPTFEL